MTPRSCLRWKPMGKVFKTVGLRWIPIGKIFKSSTTKVDSEPPHGSNTDITNLYECIQNLDSSAGTSINVQEEQTLDLNACTPFNLKKERIKVWLKDNVISGRPRIHGTTLIQEISARPRPQGIRCWSFTGTKRIFIYMLETETPLFQLKSVSLQMHMLKLQRHTLSIKILGCRVLDRAFKMMQSNEQENKALKRRQRQRSQELNDKSNIIDLTKECHNDSL
ncbi:hypothetical protein Tco_0778925 [Tanacetum coccineum]